MKTTRERIVEVIRKEFGLEDGVRFNLEDSRCNPYYFKDDKVYDNEGDIRHYSCLLEFGDIEVIPEPLLTEDERDFLKFYISSLKDGVSTIEKKVMPNGIYIKLWGDGELTAITALLKDSFEGLENELEYTLEELGL